ncbi:MAG: glycosyltransferase family 39 protein [Pseudomonadales bacterium]|nr:glycosyltransferase family 39 protein [Pseudomonadales bacterium]
MSKMVKRYPLLILIAVLAFTLRMYRINTPLLDWHSWRQADTASVTREYQKHGISLLYPKYHDVSNNPSGLPNPEGYRMVEFPLYNALVASILEIIPALPLVVTSRVVSALFSIGTLISLFFLVKSYYGKKAGYLTSFFFAVVPYSIFYSRVVLPEPSMVFFSTLSITTFRFFLKRNSNGLYLVSLVSLALSFLLKPFTAFLAPVYIVMVFEERTLKQMARDFRLYLYPVLAIAPFVAWRNWISQFPEGIPASDWLFNGNGIRFRPAWVRWLGYERITKLILGYIGTLALPVSVLASLKKRQFFISSWWLGIGLYFTVIATGNVQHDYYQAMITPIVAITLAHGVLVVDKYLSKKINPLVSIGVLSFATILMLFFSWQQVKGYFNINHPEYAEVGAKARELIPADALVVAPQYGGDTAFLFQTDRRGWPLGFMVPDYIDAGAEYYVTATLDDEAKELAEKYFIVEQTEKYLILDLTKEKNHE